MANLLEQNAYSSSAIQQMHKELAPFINSAAPLFFWGETGTGMGYYARLIHEASRNGKLLTIPCFSLDDDSVQQQFLGSADQGGWLEEAHDGTIFLKRIAETSLTVQRTLLHLVATQTTDGIIEFARKGQTERVQVNVRFIYSSANDFNAAIQDDLLLRDLVDEMKHLGKIFRIPPLRERKEDIAIIIDTLLQELNPKYGQHITSVDKKALKLLNSYSWPGNVGELRRVLDNVCSQFPGISTIFAEHIPDYVANPAITGDKYSFRLRNDERFQGKILTSYLNVKRDESKFHIKTVDLVEILRVDDEQFTPPKLKHFILKLKDGSQLAAQILDEAIKVRTSFDRSHLVKIQDLYSLLIS